MTAQKIYKKVGRRYVEIGNFDDEYLHFPHGAHLVVSRKGGTLTRYNVEPAHAAVDAALQYVHDAMLAAMHEATFLQPDKRGCTKKERDGLAAYLAIAGKPQGLRFEGASLHCVIDAAIKVLRAEVLA